MTCCVAACKWSSIGNILNECTVYAVLIGMAIFLVLLALLVLIYYLCCRSKQEIWAEY